MSIASSSLSAINSPAGLSSSVRRMFPSSRTKVFNLFVEHNDEVEMYRKPYHNVAMINNMDENGDGQQKKWTRGARMEVFMDNCKM